MRIISKFRDYYDSAAIYGIDKEIIYQREFEQVENKELEDKLIQFSKDFSDKDSLYSFFNFSPYSRKTNVLTLFPAAFFICGKLYFGIVYSPFKGGRNINDYGSYYNFSNNPTVRPFFMQYEEDFVKFENYLKEKEDEENRFYDSIMGENKIENIRNDIEIFRNKYLKSLLLLNQNSDRFDCNKVHFLFNSPLVMFNKVQDGFMVNPELRQYGIQSLIDPATLNQEISMFISGVLGNNEKETINISDKDKIIGKGFDYVSSFRKEKSKK